MGRFMKNDFEWKIHVFGCVYDVFKHFFCAEEIDDKAGKDCVQTN